MIKIQWQKNENQMGFVKNTKQGILEFENHHQKQAIKVFKLLDKCGYGLTMYRED